MLTSPGISPAGITIMNLATPGTPGSLGIVAMSALVKVRPPPLNSISPVTEVLGLPSVWFTEMTEYVYLIPTVVS